MYIKHIVIVLISSSLLACASTEESAESADYGESSGRGDCIFEPSIRGYNVLDEQNLIIEGSGRRYYHMTLQRRARGIRSSWQIQFDAPSSRVCARFSEVIFRGHFDEESIRIESIRELSPEEHEYLLIQYGKKKPEIEQAPAQREVKGADVEELDPNATDD